MIFELRRYGPGLAGLGLNVGWGQFRGVSIALGFWIVNIGKRSAAPAAAARRSIRVDCKNCHHDPREHFAKKKSDGSIKWTCVIAVNGNPCECLEFEPEIE